MGWGGAARCGAAHGLIDMQVPNAPATALYTEFESIDWLLIGN